LGNSSEFKEVSAGDLVIKVMIKSEQDGTANGFKIIGNDLQIDKEISLLDAIFGSSIEVECIDKSKRVVEIKSGLEEDSINIPNMV
jgi:DnaJ-class molecular chaperone